MYEAFFKFARRPFAAAADAQNYFPAAAIENARKTLVRCIERGEGAGLVIGPVGSGKTLLCQVLATHFKQQMATALLLSGQLGTRRGLLQAILFELGLPYRGVEEGELRLSLVDHLAKSGNGSAGMLLLVDEAHTLPWRLMEELRMITNLVRDGQPRVRLVLVGGPQLEERFASPKMDSFSQRLAARCYLESLRRDETFAYVRAQISMVGADPAKIFTEDALEAVYAASDGIPRLINQVCDHALLLSSLGGGQTLSAAGVEEAWSDLQQLPTPWQPGTTTKKQAGGVVEFGGLDEPADEEPEAIPFHSARGGVSLFGSPGAEENLDQIDQHLHDLEDDFQPAGSIGPEVEIVFDPARDPFGEPFAEEEVVLDRYTNLETDVFSQRPLVSSKEGRELSALLDAYTSSTTEAVASLTFNQPGEPIQYKPTPASPAAYRDGHAEPAAPSSAAKPQPSQTVYIQAQAPVNQAEPTDDDLIIVEDDAPGVTSHTAPAAPLVRRQEYRQLFAKLRRG